MRNSQFRMQTLRETQPPARVVTRVPVCVRSIAFRIEGSLSLGLMKHAVLIASVCFVISTASLGAQRGRGGGGASPASPRQAAPFELTGYWVSPIIEDWKFRMVIPNKGVFDGVPLNPEGRKVGMAWDPAADEKAGEQCRAFGAPGIMRLPGRLHIT